MRTRNKALLLALCAVMLVAASVLGTLAYLTSTDSVENTFTVGQVAITLDEAKVNTDGTPVEGAARVTANEYKLIPGHTYTKDPTIHVDEKSENCYIFVKVENGIANIEAATTKEEPAYTNIADQMTANGWTALEVNGAKVENMYFYNKDNNPVVSKGTNLVVFSSFKVDGDKVINGTKPQENALEGKEYIGDYAAAKVNVTAYAIQADGFDTAAAAWAAAKLA